jgi:kynurenine formamidase
MYCTAMRIIELSHPIEPGMPTYPGLPEPSWSTVTSRAESAARLGTGVSFDIGALHIAANTGTYVDSPWHYHEGSEDIAGLDPHRLVDVPIVVVAAPGGGPIGPDTLGDITRLAGAAVLFHTGWSKHWGTPEYAAEGRAPHLIAATVLSLLQARPALVGLDALNVDDTRDPTRPAHHGLLRAGIPIIEHLTGLAEVPETGARLVALPPPIRGLGSFPVRAVAVVPE